MPAGCVTGIKAWPEFPMLQINLLHCSKAFRMKEIYVPEGYQRVMPYLILKNANDFLAFTKNVFGSIEKMKYMRDEQTIMHAEITIGDSTIMFADSTDQYQPMNAGMYIIVANADETYQLALENGATSINQPADMEYGRSAGIKDPFGNTWWITSNQN